MSITVIAEIGINHNGDVSIAKKLIDMAKNAGCNIVKFQKRDPDVCVPEAQKNIIRDTPWGQITYLDYKKKIEFGKNEYDEIDAYCKKNNVEWFASAWDKNSFKFLAQYDLKYNKIASALLTDLDFVEMVAKDGKHCFVSTGMSTQDEIDTAINILRKHGCPFTAMACTSTYPCDVSECNVMYVKTLSKLYPDSIGIGYSGHEKGILPSSIAVAFGAEFIERHITIDRTMWGTDHAASLAEDGFQRLCRDVENVGKIIGTGNKAS